MTSLPVSSPPISISQKQTAFVFLHVRYAWTIAECGQCRNHLGWRFTSVKRGLNPSKFWGLTRASLRPTLVYEEESDPENKRTPAAPPSPWRAVRICYITSLGRDKVFPYTIPQRYVTVVRTYGTKNWRRRHDLRALPKASSLWIKEMLVWKSNVLVVR